MKSKEKQVLVTGGGTFLGDSIAAALLAEGADVTLLVRPEAEEKLGPMAQLVRRYTADVWDPASLRGRARGHTSVIHTVGSLIADPAQGLSYHRLNFLSARNIANMCVSDGVQHMVLMSAVRAPWIHRQYLSAKREAESYVMRVGLEASIIRAPITYTRGSSRPLFFRVMSLLGMIPPFSWILFRRIAPIPIDILARGVARIALQPEGTRIIYYAPDLRKRNSRDEIRSRVGRNPAVDAQQAASHAGDTLNGDPPFGWSPTDRSS